MYRDLRSRAAAPLASGLLLFAGTFGASAQVPRSSES